MRKRPENHAMPYPESSRRKTGAVQTTLKTLITGRSLKEYGTPFSLHSLDSPCEWAKISTLNAKLTPAPEPSDHPSIPRRRRTSRESSTSPPPPPCSPSRCTCSAWASGPCWPRPSARRTAAWSSTASLCRSPCSSPSAPGSASRSRRCWCAGSSRACWGRRCCRWARGRTRICSRRERGRMRRLRFCWRHFWARRSGEFAAVSVLDVLMSDG